MDDFSLAPGLANLYGLVGSQANAIAANKRPLSSMSPAILTRDGRVRLVAGASGGPLIISSTLQVILAVVDFSLPVGEAVAAPRIHHQWRPDSLGLEPTAGELAGLSLGRLGHKVFPLRRAAAVAAIEVTEAGLMVAVSDPRKGGRPAAY
jgi:gamma-glutamyltranspeptidase/glutathione hydrolase